MINQLNHWNQKRLTLDWTAENKSPIKSDMALISEISLLNSWMIIYFIQEWRLLFTHSETGRNPCMLSLGVVWSPTSRLSEYNSYHERAFPLTAECLEFLLVLYLIVGIIVCNSILIILSFTQTYSLWNSVKARKWKWEHLDGKVLLRSMLNGTLHVVSPLSMIQTMHLDIQLYLYQKNGRFTIKRNLLKCACFPVILYTNPVSMKTGTLSKLPKLK